MKDNKNLKLENNVYYLKRRNKELKVAFFGSMVFNFILVIAIMTLGSR